MSTSKLILSVSWIISLILTTIVIVGAFVGIDMTCITTLAGLAWGELTAAHSFYFWKAKNENRAKYAMKLIKDLADEHGMEAVIGLAQVILQE